MTKAKKRKKRQLSEELMRCCYWLAHFYQTNPTDFLRLPEARIRQHMKYSAQLYDKITRNSRR